mmetsp:Transcript_29768/g.41104  ORF Transcript_29768/g.41104 Transcript_29768/m.41104 type:complete len:151 (+) Transcript_29768:217-669(+)
MLYNVDSLEEAMQKYGPGISGALFGVGWWVWVDAVCVSTNKVPGSEWVPGLVAVLAMLMMNVVPKDSMPYDVYDGPGCRSRLWLFLSYVASFLALAAAVFVLISHYANNPYVLDAAGMWPGVATVIQSSLIIGSGILMWISRSPSESNSF